MDAFDPAGIEAIPVYGGWAYRTQEGQKQKDPGRVLGPPPMWSFPESPSEFHASLTAATSLVRVSLASPNRRVVLSSKRSSLSIPAKPGGIALLRKTMFCAWSALMIGIP